MQMDKADAPVLESVTGRMTLWAFWVANRLARVG
jgi:hypothetical protein